MEGNEPRSTSQDTPNAIADIISKCTRGHILMYFLRDTSKVLRGSGIPPALIFQWFLFIFGALVGSSGINVLNWFVTKIMNYSISLGYILFAITVICGNSILPPLTPMNGCINLTRRLFWSFLILGHYWLMDAFFRGSSFETKLLASSTTPCRILALLTSLTSFEVVSLISGYWHFHLGNANYRKAQVDVHLSIQERVMEVASQRNLDRFLNGNENEKLTPLLPETGENMAAMMGPRFMEDIIQFLQLCFFRTTCGIGILWTLFDSYTKRYIYYATYFIVAFHLGIYMLGRANRHI